MFRLVSDQWEKEVLGARRASPKGLRVICPFIKTGTMSRILDAGSPGPLEVITRFDLGCFYDGVSDLEALENLLDNGAKIRGVKGLHAKLFLFGGQIAIGTSANVTDAGMLRNYEFGFISDDPDVLRSCQDHFGALWTKSGDDLTSANLREWRKLVAHARRNGSGRSRPRLPDFGARARVTTPFAAVSGERTYTNQAFLKFYGRGAERTSRDLLIADMVAESGCNWACTYPSSHRPRQVQDGDVLYMARIAAPQDLLIFGCALGWRHRDDEDVASRAEIQARPWKQQFSNYIRVHDARFLDAKLGAGVSMYEMLRELGADSWRSTQDNVRAGKGNTDPFASYLRKPGMQLTDTSRAWIEERLERLFRRYGEVDLRPRRFRPPK